MHKIVKRLLPKFDKKLYYFDEKAASRVVTFIETHCKHVQGNLAGQPLKLEDWQLRDIIYPVFGLKNKSDRLRKHRVIWIEIPKKNGKSTLIAALNIYMLCADGEKGGEVFCAANDRGQARIVFELAQDMIRQSEFLNSRIQVLRNSCWHPKSNSYLKPISSESKTKHGFHLSGVTIDEIEEFMNGELWHTLHKGTSGRSQPLVWVLTNSGYLNTWPYTMHERARKIKDGVFDEPTWHVVIYGADDDADIFDPKVWETTNPNWNKELSDSMAADSREVRQMPSAENEFRRLRLGQWVGSSHAWISPKTVELCNHGRIALEILRGRRAYGGLDLSGGGDFNAYSLLFPPEKKGGMFEWLLFSWIPYDTMLKRSMNEHTNVIQWEKDSWLLTVQGNVIGDYGPIAGKIKELHEMFDIRLSGYDAWRKWGIIPMLERDGMPLEPYRQGPATMGVPIDELEKLFMESRINTGGNPVIEWQMDNVMIYKDKNGNKWMDKSTSKDKIDGPVSLANAMCAYLHSEAEGEAPLSVYENRGIITLEW